MVSQRWRRGAVIKPEGCNQRRQLLLTRSVMTLGPAERERGRQVPETVCAASDDERRDVTEAERSAESVCSHFQVRQGQGVKRVRGKAIAQDLLRIFCVICSV